jgi:hypothetical protein
LSVNKETIRFGETTIRREEITEIKYWIGGIQFYRFLVGRWYHIGLKTPANQVNIILKVYLGIGNDYFSDLCSRIIDEIWEPVTDRLYNKNKELLLAGGTMLVGTCQVSKAGILINRSNGFSSKQKRISWDDLDYEKKYDRLVLNSKSDPGAWVNLYFQHTWNIDILMTLLDWVTKENGLAELQSA